MGRRNRVYAAVPLGLTHSYSIRMNYSLRKPVWSYFPWLKIPECCARQFGIYRYVIHCCPLSEKNRAPDPGCGTSDPLFSRWLNEMTGVLRMSAASNNVVVPTARSQPVRDITHSIKSTTNAHVTQWFKRFLSKSNEVAKRVKLHTIELENHQRFSDKAKIARLWVRLRRKAMVTITSFGYK